MFYLEPAYTVCDVFCAMTLLAMNMATVAHGIPQAFRKVQESDESIREELGVTYVKTTEE